MSRLFYSLRSEHLTYQVYTRSQWARKVQIQQLNVTPSWHHWYKIRKLGFWLLKPNKYKKQKKDKQQPSVTFTKATWKSCYIYFTVCLYDSYKAKWTLQFQLPEGMHENVVSISHIPELLLWPSQSNLQNLDKPLTKHPSESTKQIRKSKRNLLLNTTNIAKNEDTLYFITHAFNGRDYPREPVPISILMKQKAVSGSGISWAICKSAPRSSQTIMPAPRPQFFTSWMPFLSPN